MKKVEQGSNGRHISRSLHSYHQLEVPDILQSRHKLLDWFSLYRRRLPWRGDHPPYSVYKETRQHVSCVKQQDLHSFLGEKSDANCTSGQASPQSSSLPVKGLKHFMYRPCAYGTWVSEVMLQQTQVSVVIPYWIEWVQRWPTLLQLTRATEQEICSMWAGLGYYQRAIRILQSARAIALSWLRRTTGQSSCLAAAQSQGKKAKRAKLDQPQSCDAPPSFELTTLANNVTDDMSDKLNEIFRLVNTRHYPPDWDVPFPRDSMKTLMQYKGIGEYTAAAILSISFGRTISAIDGNVIRVVSRFLAIARDPESPILKHVIKDFMKLWICEERPGSFNEALMDLGATICTPRAPLCNVCPLNSYCIAYKEVSLGKTVNWRRIHHREEVDSLCQLCDPAYQDSAETVVVYPLKKSKNNTPNREGACQPLIKVPKSQYSRRSPEEHVALILFAAANGHPCFLFAQRPMGLLGKQWGPMVLPIAKSEMIVKEEELKNEIDTGALDQKILTFKSTLYDEILEHLHLNHIAFSDLYAVSSFQELKRKTRLPVFNLGHIRHVFSHVTHDVTVLAIPIAKDMVAPFLKSDEFLYRWVSVADVSRVDWKSLWIVSTYMKKIMSLFIEAFETVAHMSQNL